MATLAEKAEARRKARQGGTAATAATAAAPAKEPGGWNSFWDNPIMNYEVMSAEQVAPFNAVGEGIERGVTFGYGDEIGGGLRSMIGRDGQAYTERRRAQAAALEAEYPKLFAAGEVAGALGSMAIPGAAAIAGPVRGVQGARAATSLANAAVRGAVYGGADAALRASGEAVGGMDRIRAGVAAAPGGAAFGAALGPVAELAPKFAPQFFSSLRQKFGAVGSDAVERNIKDIAEKSGMSVDDITARIMAGETLAGMNSTTRVLARSLANRSSLAGEAMIKATSGRLGTAVDEAVTSAKTALVGPTRAAAANLRGATEATLKGNIDTAGTTLAAARASTAMADPATIAGMEQAVARSPKVAAKANEALQANLMPPLFEKGPNGVWQMVRTPTIGEADVLASEMGHLANLAFEAPGTIAKGAGPGIQRGKTVLREAIDTADPNLKPLRDAYSAAKDASGIGFPLGTKARSLSPDELALGFGKLADPGKDAARMGAATRIGELAGKTRRDTSLIDEMMDSGRYLGGNIDEMALTPLDRSVTSPLARAQSEGRLLDKLGGNSSTTEQLIADKAITSKMDVPRIKPLDVAERFGGILMLSDNLARLDERGLMALADDLMKSGPEGAALLKRAMNRKADMADIVSLERIARRVSGMAAPTDLLGMMEAP